jgi:hypothetical protein
MMLRPTATIPALPSTSDVGNISFDTPQIDLKIEKCKSAEVWHMFSEFHYMDKKINNANRFFVAWWRSHPGAHSQKPSILCLYIAHKEGTDV